MIPVAERLILASKSPRRSELLRRCGVDFSVKTLDARELTYFEPLELLPEKNALIKASATAAVEPDSWVLGADTMIIFDGRAIGKPGSPAEAFEMLLDFSGRTHKVVTGLALINQARQITLSWSETSEVTFKTLAPETVDRYLASVEVMDKAGAYAIQEHGELIIEKFTGELENIIGLPLKKLQILLKEYSIQE